MADQHVKIFQALGMPEDKIQEIEKIVDTKDFKPDAYTGTLTEIQKNKLLNDEAFLNSIPEDKLPALRKSIESGQYTRFLKELGEVAGELGVKVEDMSEETRKSLKGMARETNKRYLEKHGGDNKGAVTELQTKLQEALRDKEALTTSQQARIDEIVSKEKGSSMQKLEKLTGIIKTASIEGLTIKPEYALPPAMEKMKNIHDVVFNPDSLEFELKQKGKPQLDVLKPNGSKLTFDEELRRILKEDGVISDKVPETDKRSVTTRVMGDNAVVVPDYIREKMQVGLKEESTK